MAEASSGELNNGQKFEIRCFGRCTSLGNPAYMPYADAMKFVKDNQGSWNPFYPDTKFGRGLLRILSWIMSEAIRRFCSPDIKPNYRLGLLVAVDTALDRYHSIDALAVMQDIDSGHESYAKIDVTLSHSKVVTEKADVVFQEPDVAFIETFADEDKRIDVPEGILSSRLLLMGNILFTDWRRYHGY